MTKFEAIAALVRAAGVDAERGTAEVPPGSNRGARVEEMLANVGVEPGEPWCAAAVSTWGIEALGAAWPLPRTADCDVLLDFARRKGVLSYTPSTGDVFLVRASADDATHTGIVVQANPGGATFATIEGNSNPSGGREGWKVVMRPSRSIAGSGNRPATVFVRWASLYKVTNGKTIGVWAGTQHILNGRIDGGVAVVPVRAFLTAFLGSSEVEEALAYEPSDNLLTWKGNPIPVQPKLYGGSTWAPVRGLGQFLNLLVVFDSEASVVRVSRG